MASRQDLFNQGLQNLVGGLNDYGQNKRQQALDQERLARQELEQQRYDLERERQRRQDDAARNREAAAYMKDIKKTQGLEATPEQAAGIAESFRAGDTGTIADITSRMTPSEKFLKDQDKIRKTEDLKNRKLEAEAKKLERDSLGINKQQKMSTSQHQAMTFAERIGQSEKNFKRLVNSGYKPENLREHMKRAFIPEYFKNENLKLQEQAERNFVNAVLRRESGAAIAPQEFESAQKQYFPSAGDTPAVLAQKAENRRIVYEGLQSEARGGARTIKNTFLDGNIIMAQPQRGVSITPSQLGLPQNAGAQVQGGGVQLQPQGNNLLNSALQMSREQRNQMRLQLTGRQ